MSKTPATIDPQKQDRARKDEKLERRQWDKDLHEVMQTSAGRRLIWALLERIGMFTLSYSGEQTHNAAFLEGRRSVANELWGELERVAMPALVMAQQHAYQRKLAEAREKDERGGDNG